MDQPGNSQYPQHTSQQTLNGHSAYYGRADYDGSGYQANGYNGYNGNGQDGQAPYGGQASAGYPAEVVIPEARPAAEATVATTAEAVLDDTAQDAAPEQETATADEATPSGQDTVGATQAQAQASNSAAERMRELLARSTVDHQAIERATATTLVEIRQRLADLERAVAEVREHTGAEHDSANRAAEQMSTQAQRLAGMSATLDGLTAGLSTFSAQLSAIDGRLANADSRLTGVDVKLASTEGRVTALDTRFERLDERLDDQYDRVTSIDNRLAATDSRITLLSGHFTESLKPIAEEVRARLGRAEVEDVVTKVVESAHGDISYRLTSLEDTVLTLAEALLRPAPGHTPAPHSAPRQ